MNIQLEQFPEPPRKIRFNFNALAEYEDMTGKSALEIDNLGISQIRALAYCGLKEADESFDLSLRDVGALLNTENMQEVIKALTHDLSTEKAEKK